MKSRESYLDSIYSKRDEYVSQQRHKRKTVLSVCIPLVICLTAVSFIMLNPPEVQKETFDIATAGAPSGMDNNTENECAVLGTAATDGEYCGQETENNGADTAMAMSAETARADTTRATESDSTAPSSAQTKQSEAATTQKESAGGSEDFEEVAAATTATTTTKESTTASGNTVSTITTADRVHPNTGKPTTTVPTTTVKAYASLSEVPALRGAKIYVKSAGEYPKTYDSQDASALAEIRNAFLWALCGETEELPASDTRPEMAFVIELSLEDGEKRIFEWSDGCICDESGTWRKLSDARNSAISDIVLT